jgi:ATP-dependent Lon protease
MIKIKNLKITNNTQPSANVFDNTKHSIPPSTPNNIQPKEIEEQICILQDIIKRTVVAVHKYKEMNVFGSTDLSVCLQLLEGIFVSLKNTPSTKSIQTIQEAVDTLSAIFNHYGTESLQDLLYICFGIDFVPNYILSQPQIADKFNIMNNYVHPIGYKRILKRSDKTNSIATPIITTAATTAKNQDESEIKIKDKIVNMLDCFDLSNTSKTFKTKVYGIKIVIHNKEKGKSIYVNALVDPIFIECLNYDFIKNKLHLLNSEKPKDPEFGKITFERFVSSLTLKDLLVYSNNQLYSNYLEALSQVKIIKQIPISQVIKDFVSSDLYAQRNIIINLLLKSTEHEYQYISYLLYDILTNDINGTVDSHEQTLLLDSLPYNYKKYFSDAMGQTVKYINNLSNIDTNKFPIEQQICLMKVDDHVKEKAMVKFKEIKSKSDDSGSKARQYLDGLLKIPFGIYKQEPILSMTSDSVVLFNNLIETIKTSPLSHFISSFPTKEKYNSVEMRNYSRILGDNIKIINNNNSSSSSPTYAKCINDTVNIIKKILESKKKDELSHLIIEINQLIKTNNSNKPHDSILHRKIGHTGKKLVNIKNDIIQFVEECEQEKNMETLLILISKLDQRCADVLKTTNSTLLSLEQKTDYVSEYIQGVRDTLDEAVHGHSTAKRQVERIIGQWINGENTGYCFGFEGPPGVGKTSLAKKGIAKCLKDGDGNARPFAFIAIGGSSNGSTLDGHNYTYVGSTWGRILEILMETKCMNPIIFIDELDKVSKTEHGKEIIGILTHLIDPTQNDSFQDKYFNGINIDLSRALFIFSYNDAESIDKILLDRIHRIKFDNLSLDEKMTIAKKHILPETFSKMGMSGNGVIEIDDSVIEYIINEYTYEPGVRKLKEVAFDIFGEINISMLREKKSIVLPLRITNDDIKYKYLKDRHEIFAKKIHATPTTALVNGLWANSMGRGGVLPIEASFFPSSTFLDLKLTGLQGEVMKESMSVAKTIAWSLLTRTEMDDIRNDLEKTKNQGVHVHTPEGATPKDGPSAGTAIVIVLYSLFTGKKIRNDVAITGEICLQGNVTAIGGLDLKILGGIRAGVKTFLFPVENDKDYCDFKKKYVDNPILNGITFLPIANVKEAIDIVTI